MAGLCTAVLALACALPASAFSLVPHTVGAPVLRRSALATSPRPRLQLGRLHAQLRPEDDNMKRGETKFDLNTGLRDVVTSAQEGWAKGAGERDSATDALPNLMFVPLWAGVAAMGFFLPAPELLESMLTGVGHGGVESANAADLSAAVSGVLGGVGTAAAAAAKTVASGPGFSQGGLNLEQLGSPQLDPTKFVPVCQFSDGFYRAAQATVYKAAGKDVYQEYSPLIAGSLLRVRLEFCVLESFVYESIIPFVKARGLSWVFPFKETLETFVAGTVFAVASNLVLIGSTKIVTIVVSYCDIFIGLPLRLIFGFSSDRLKGAGADKNALAPLYIGTSALKAVGKASELVRKGVEAADVFVGRYLLLTTVGYVGLKFLKFKGVLTLENLGAFFSGAAGVVSKSAEMAGRLAQDVDAELFLPAHGVFDTVAATIDSSLLLDPSLLLTVLQIYT